MRLEITEEAESDLANIRAWIRPDNPEAAGRVVAGILDQLELLPEQPGIGRAGRIDGTRELVVQGLPYIACYAVTDQAMTILRVLHGRQQWPQAV